MNTLQLYNEKFWEIVNIAESFYGPRDMKILLKSLDCEGGDGAHAGRINNEISISLSSKAIDDPNQGFLDLSHEIVHFLGPGTNEPVTYLEEGMSVFFSFHYVKKYVGWDISVDTYPSITSEYKKAYELFKQLYEIDNDIIMKIRASNPTIAQITKKNLLVLNKNLPSILLDQLMRPIY